MDPSFTGYEMVLIVSSVDYVLIQVTNNVLNFKFLFACKKINFHPLFYITYSETESIFSECGFAL